MSRAPKRKTMLHPHHSDLKIENGVAVVRIPRPDERAVLLLARTYAKIEDPDYVSVSWACQERAMAFFEAHDLIDTLDEIVKLGGEL